MIQVMAIREMGQLKIHTLHYFNECFYQTVFKTYISQKQKYCDQEH